MRKWAIVAFSVLALIAAGTASAHPHAYLPNPGPTAY